MSEEELILSLDLGTSNIKGAVFDIHGNEIVKESSEYSLLTSGESIVENDVLDYWEKIRIILKNLTLKLGASTKKIIAIVTSSQAETILPVDNKINPLRNAIAWLDMRSIEEAKEIRANFDTEQLFEITGYPEVDPSWPATRILWLKKHESKIFFQTYKFMLLHDYILYKLSGEIAGEATTYNSSYYYNIRKFEYIGEILDFIGIKKNKLPEVFKSGTVVGNIEEDLAKDYGFNKKTKIIAGALDQVCGAVGAGNIMPGIATETTGSAFAMIITTGSPVINNELKLPCILHAVPNTYGLMPYSTTGGIVLKWFKDNFFKKEVEEALNSGKNIYKILDEEADKIPPGSEGLIMLPFLTGAMFPEYDPSAKAVFFGLGINHKREHFTRAILEALAYMMCHDIEAIKKTGIDVNRVISMGGGAESNLWNQIKADVCRVRIDRPSYTDTALLGASMIAAVSLGLFKNLEAASKYAVKVEKSYLPQNKNKQVYYNGFNKYKNLYLKLKGFF
jgi:sugar (pentulose or hexulose) kinase